MRNKHKNDNSKIERKKIVMDYYAKRQLITYWYIDINNNVKFKVWQNDDKDQWRLLNDNVYLEYVEALNERSKLL